jgi:hypothetical protein
MEEVELEITCIYARNYNLLLKLKEESDYDDAALVQLRTLVNNEVKDKQAQVVEDYCFNCHPGAYDPSKGPKQSITYGQFVSWV